MSRHNLLPVREDLADGRARHERLMPLVEVRVLALDLAILLAEQQRKVVVPWHPGKISIGDFVADKVASSLLAEMAVDDLEYALDFVAVTLDSARDLFPVEHGEPGTLAEIGA